MAFEKYTIRQFMNAMWGGSDCIPANELDEVYSEYIDIAEMYDGEDFNKVAYIHYLNNRVNSVVLSLALQRDFIKEFDSPYKPAFSFLWKFGHRVNWNGSKEDFEKQLQRIEAKEKKYVAQLDSKIVELKSSRDKKPKQEVTEKQTRGSFIRTVNSLGKIGYKIDNDRTTMEELAYMIKQQKEEYDNLNSKV